MYPDKKTYVYRQFREFREHRKLKNFQHFKTHMSKIINNVRYSYVLLISNNIIDSGCYLIKLKIIRANVFRPKFEPTCYNLTTFLENNTHF